MRPSDCCYQYESLLMLDWFLVYRLALYLIQICVYLGNGESYMTVQ